MAGSKTILFIEDDEFIVDMYSHALKKAGYTVDSAYTGQEGIEKARAKDYDLILLDLMLPEITGIDILKQLRSPDSGKPDTKIVILTNLAQDEESRAAIESQADGYLIKADVTPKKLVNLLGDMLGS